MFDDEVSDPGEGQMPPCDLDAEALVVAHVLVAGSIDTVREHLRPSDFWSEANRLIYQACVDLAMQDAAIEPVAVKRALSDKGQLDRVGGIRYILDIVQKTPATAYVVDHAKSIAANARVRRMIEAAERIRILGYSANGSSTEYLAAALASVQIVVDDDLTAGESPFAWANAVDIAQPLPPIRWVCPEMCIGPGRPTLVAGYGFSGKTIVDQALALSVAAGERLFGAFGVRQGAVRHLDYEQGKDATNRRYQRLAFGMGVDLAAIGDALKASYFPRLYLTGDGIEAILCRECANVSLCVIDSFLAAAPGTKENESGMRVFLDTLTRVSEHTGCAFVVIHHAGKSPSNGEKKAAAEKPRGSSAIFDACGTVLILSASAPYEPIRVELAKVSASAAGKQFEPFYLKFEDVPDDEARDDKAGLRVVHQSTEEAVKAESKAGRFAALKATCADYVRRHPGASQRDVRNSIDGRAGEISDALHELADKGVLENRGTATAGRWWIK